MSVTRFLVTGTDEQLIGFHLGVAFLLNAIERRGQTILYACMAEDRDFALRMARESGVTLQELLEDENQMEDRIVVVQGENPGWKGNRTEGARDAI